MIELGRGGVARDGSVVGLDDLRVISQRTRPGLTTVALLHLEMGRRGGAGSGAGGKAGALPLGGAGQHGPAGGRLMGAIALRGVRKSCGGTEVIGGVDLDVPDGSFTIFVGPSG